MHATSTSITNRARSTAHDGYDRAECNPDERGAYQRTHGDTSANSSGRRAGSKGGSCRTTFPF